MTISESVRADPVELATSEPAAVPNFAVISGGQVQQALQGHERQILEVVEETYRLHGKGDSVNPPSYFLRFPDRPSSRIIALPASIGGQAPVDGLKWISSFPDNVHAGIPRASAVLILNDHVTGYPFACLESSIISATRTAASAALAADWLSRDRERPRRVGFIGVGLIARYIHTFLAATGWTFDEIGVHDLSADSAEGFRGYLEQSGAPGLVVLHDGAESLIRSSDLVVFATVAGQPHVHDVSWFEHNPLVLHVSLRDLAPEILLASTNIVDDVEHCLKADTSPHLAEQLTGSRSFVDGTLDDVMAGQVRLPADRPLVFSPFGLGVLDLAVGKYVYDHVVRSGELNVVDDFFPTFADTDDAKRTAYRFWGNLMPVVSMPEQYNEDDLYVDLEPTFGQPLYLKCEGFNFAGSIKLKAANAMVEAAERDGYLRPGSILVESSSGNLGVALSTIAASRGYGFLCITDSRCNLSTRRLMEALGSQVHIVSEPDPVTGLLGARINYVKSLCYSDDRYVWLNQYANPENWKSHYRTTAPAIEHRFPELDVLFVGAGTTGSLMGCARYFRESRRSVHIVAIDAVGSQAFGGPPARRMIPGLGTSVRPPLLDESFVDEVVRVEEADTIRACHRLASKGFLFGGSTGTVVSGAMDWLAQCGTEATTAVALAPDLGERYLDTVYQSNWVQALYGDDVLDSRELMTQYRSA